jgi:hypothetical protein
LSQQRPYVAACVRTRSTLCADASMMTLPPALRHVLVLVFLNGGKEPSDSLDR